MKKHPDIKGFVKKNPEMRVCELAQETGYSESYIRHIRQGLGLPPFRKTAFNEVLKEEGFDPKNWSHGWLKSDKASIFIRNEEGIMTYDDIKEELIAEMKKHAPKYKVLKRKKVKDGHLFVVDPADVHIGKLALLAETNEDYNIEIAKQRCLEGVQGLIDKAEGFPIEKILLVIGNDIIHIDSPKRQTTSGTPQDTDQQWWTMFTEAKDLYIQVIEMV
jgi:hypothetical protein